MALIVTAVFLALAGYFLIAALAAWALPGGSTPSPGTSVWHLVMSLAMALMAWPRALPPPVVLVLVFTAAALWFAFCALYRPDRVHHDHSGGDWYHAVMMAAMVLMTVAMATWATPTGQAGDAGADLGAHAAGMAGMSMPGMTPVAGGSAAAAPVGATAIGVMCVVAAIGFTAAAALLATDAFRRRLRRGWSVAESGSAVVMAAGMAAAFFELR